MITPAQIDETVLVALGTEAYPIRRLHQKLGRPRVARGGNRNGPEPRVFWRRV